MENKIQTVQICDIPEALFYEGKEYIKTKSWDINNINFENIDTLANFTKKELNKIEMLSEIAEDKEITDSLINDFLEGETNVYELMDIIYNQIQEREIMVAGIKEALRNMNERKSRLDNSINKLRSVMSLILQRSNQSKIVRPLYTASIKSTPEKIHIDDEMEISSSYYEAKTEYVLDKKRILEDLKAGKEVKGATLTEKGFTIMIRNK